MSAELKLSVMHFFNLLMSPNEHSNVGWTNLVSTTEKIYVHICAHQELMVTKNPTKFQKRRFHYARDKNAFINNLFE